MTQQQAQLLVAILHRLNTPQDDITRAIIDDFTKATGAYEPAESSDVSCGAPEVGRPVLTVHSD